MWFLKFIFTLSVVYGIIVAVAYVAQTWLIFPASLVGRGSELPPGADYIRLSAQNGDGVVLVHIPAREPSKASNPTLLGFGGNAWSADALAIMLHRIFPDHDVASLYYRGYGPSEGRPSATAVFEDARLAFDRVEEASDAGVIVVGLSLGASVAVELAATRPVQGMVLITPFDSLKALAANHYPWLPVRLLIKHHMEAAQTLRDLNVPTAIITAERDVVVPAIRSDPVRMAATELRGDFKIKSAGHNDVYDKPAFVEALRNSIKALRQN